MRRRPMVALALALALAAGACGDDDPSATAGGEPRPTAPGRPVDGVTALDGVEVADPFHASVAALGPGPESGAAVADGLAVVDGARRLVVTSVLDGTMRRSVDADRPPLFRSYASWDGSHLVVSGTSCPDLPLELPEMFDEYDVDDVCGPDAAPVVRTLEVATGTWSEVPFPIEGGVDDGVIATRHGTALAFTGASDPGIRLTPLETEGWTPDGGALDVEGLAAGGLCARDDGTLLVPAAEGVWLLGDGEPTAVTLPPEVGTAPSTRPAPPGQPDVEPGRSPTDDLVCDHDGNLLVDPDLPDATSLVRVVVDPDGSTRTEALALPEGSTDSPQLTTTATGPVLWAYGDGQPALRGWIRDGDGWRALADTSAGPDALVRPAVVGTAVIGLAGLEVRVLT